MRALWMLGLLLLITTLVNCNRAETPKQTAAKGGSEMAFSMKSSAFDEGATIPKKYSCEGEDVSPPLAWSDAPKGTASFALICDDPDAPVGNWTHWVLWGLPADTMTLSEGVPKTATLANGAKQGLNSWPKVGYNGPCPPPGKPHRYFFKLFALDTALTLSDKTDKARLEKALQGHILGEAHVMGKYQR